MSDTRDEDTGQFAQSTDGLYGREHEEAAAGFKPMDVKPKEGDTELSVRGAADELTESRSKPEDDKIVIYDTATGDPINSDPSEGVVESLTVEDAARLLSSYHDSKGESAAKSISADFAAEVDKMRAEALKANPKLAEHFGIEPPLVEGKPAIDKPDNGAIADEWAVSSDDGLDPKLAEQIRQHPQVRQMLEDEVTQSRQVREQYSTGLENARVHTLATLAEVVPHLAGLPPQQFEQGLALLSQVDPPAFQQAMNILGRAHTIVQAQHQHQQQHAQAQAQEFQTFKVTEDAKLAEALGDDRGLVRQYQSKVEPYFKSLGLTQGEMLALANDRTVNSAAGQRVLLDAMRYQEIKNAQKGVASRNLPPVQRPGASQPRASSDSEALQRLTAQFDRNPTPKNGAALHAAKSRARAR